MRGRVRFDFANRGHACLHVQVAVKKSGSKQWDLGDYVRQRSEGAAEAPVALAARAPLIATRPMSVWALPALELAAAIRDDSEWDSESDESEEEEEEEGAPKRSERINVVVSVDLLPLPDIRCFFPRTIACVETSVLTICFCLAPHSAAARYGSLGISHTPLYSSAWRNCSHWDTPTLVRCASHCFWLLGA